MSRGCPICTERLEEDLASSPCGHVFHHTCLSQWVLQKESCPQCRAPCKKNKILKLFMPDANYYDDEDEGLLKLSPEELRSELETCKGILKQQDESLAKAKQELIDSREEMSAWRCQYDSLHKKYKIQEASSSCFQTQLKAMQEDRDRVMKDLSATRKRVEDLLGYKRMKEMLNQDPVEVAGMLKDPCYTRKELAKVLVTTKRKLEEALQSKDAAWKEAMDAKEKAQNTREHLVRSVSECQALRDEGSSLSAEVDSLKKKVELLGKVATETPESKRALCRILESPMPDRYHKRQRLEDDTDDSDIEGYLLSSKPCSSKYSHLQEKAAEVGIDLPVAVTSNSDRIRRHNSFTRPLTEVPLNVLPKPKAEEGSKIMRVGYNGLGGKSSYLKPSAPKPAVHQQPKLRFVPRKKLK